MLRLFSSTVVFTENNTITHKQKTGWDTTIHELQTKRGNTIEAAGAECSNKETPVKRV